MPDQYSRSELLSFLDIVGNQGLGNANTVQSLKVACSKILSDLSEEEEEDVRKIDVDLAIRKFNNKNPGALAPASLAEYQRRVTLAIRELQKWKDNPTGYKGFGKRQPKLENGEKAGQRPRQARPREVQSPQPTNTSQPQPDQVQMASGLTYAFPLRTSFLAQLVVPRDLKADEAKRLCAFIQTLATDFSPAA